MTTEIFLRYIHFISIFAIAATLVSEHLLLRPVLKRRDLVKIARIDGVYGLAVVTLLAAGLTLWLGSFGKPAEYYNKNWVFHTKIALFTIVGLLSIYPTVFFLKNRKGDPEQEVAVPAAIVWMVRVEILILFIIPLLAGLMARGIGSFD